MKQDHSLEKVEGVLNIEPRTDGGVGIYIDCKLDHKTLPLTKQETRELAKWLVMYLNKE